MDMDELFAKPLAQMMDLTIRSDSVDQNDVVLVLMPFDISSHAVADPRSVSFEIETLSRFD